MPEIWEIILIHLTSLALLATSAVCPNQTIYAVANSHLDTVWSWQLEQTIEEFIPYTLDSNFELIEKYPDYQFNFEGAYRYQLMEEYYPERFERLKGYVASGSWNPVGSGLENGDVNSPSPEALFRNFLYGNNYFENTFGRRSADVFLPDCFGFGWALPSIASHANLIGFTTQKLSWGNTFPNEKLPFDIGMWLGPDGKGVIANINGNDYTSRFDYGAAKNFGTLSRLLASPVGKSVALYGSNGDRGGPPAESTVAAISEETGAPKNWLFPWITSLFSYENNASPLLGRVSVKFASPEQVFRDITPSEQKKLPSYSGELLLHHHGAGGYTSRAISKRWNRRAEELADAAERSLTAAGWLGALDYPQAEMERIWTNLVSHQFHDDMPGTSNSTVYQRTWNDLMTDIMQFAAEYENGAAGVASMMDTRTAGIPLVVNNPVAARRTDAVEATVEIPSQPDFIRVYDDQGNEVPSQIISRDGAEYTIVFIAEVDSMGYRVYDVRPADEPCAMATGLGLDGNILQNEKYIVKMDENGDVASIVDKTLNKELLNAPLRLAQFSDDPLRWPSWEINFNDYFAKAPKRYVGGAPVITAVEAGPARIALKIEREFRYSKYTQVVSLTAGGACVVIDNVVDWNERATLLKAEFDLTSANKTAAYDLGLGVIERGSNSEGSDCEHKKAEVPHQKWADLTAKDGSYGVSIINDGKIGIDKPDDSTLRLSLIHTPEGDFKHGMVDAVAGQSVQEVGENRFSYAVYSHAGKWNDSGVQLEAAALNQPMNAFQTGPHAGPLGGHYSFGGIGNDQVLLRAVKKAERGDEIIVRFNEGADKAQSNVRFTLGEGIVSAREVYASEEAIGPALAQNGALVFDIGKFGVKTFALTLKAPTAAASGKTAQAMDLSALYNIDMYSSNANKSDGSLSDCYPAELVPDEILFAGVTYQTGDKADGVMNAVRSAGQVISLPAGYTQLKLLAASTNGDKQADFTIDGRVITREIADFAENIAAWDLIDLRQSGYVKEQTPAFKATHRHTAGADNIAASTYMFLYTFDIDGASSVTLPGDGDIVIFAATATDGGAFACVSPLRDKRERAPFVAPVNPKELGPYGESFAYAYAPQPAARESEGVLLPKAEVVTKDGSKAVRFTGIVGPIGRTNAFQALYQFDDDERIKIKPGMTLSYEYYAENKLGRYVAVDLAIEGGANFRDCGAVDQRGVSVHPKQPRTETTGEWIPITIEIGNYMPGAVIKEVRLAYDHAGDLGRYSAYVRNVEIG